MENYFVLQFAENLLDSSVVLCKYNFIDVYLCTNKITLIKNLGVDFQIH